MADKKIAASLVNVIKFDIDRASMQRALKAIKDVKKAMSDVTAPFNAAKRYTQELKRQTAELQKQKSIVNSTKSKQQPIIPSVTRSTRTPREVPLMSSEDKRKQNFANRQEADAYFFKERFGWRGARRFEQLKQQYSAGGMSAQMYASRLRILRSELYANQRAQKGFNDSIHSMRSAFIAATASYTAFAGIMAVANVGKQFQRSQGTMAMAFGSQQAGAEQNQWAQQQAYKYGLNLPTTVDNYAKLAVAAKDKMTLQQTQGLFTGYSKYAMAAGTSKERTENGLIALQQMLS